MEKRGDISEQSTPHKCCGGRCKSSAAPQPLTEKQSADQLEQHVMTDLTDAVAEKFAKKA